MSYYSPEWQISPDLFTRDPGYILRTSAPNDSEMDTNTLYNAQTYMCYWCLLVQNGTSLRSITGLVRAPVLLIKTLTPKNVWSDL